MPERGGANAAPETGGGSDVRVAKVLFGKYEVGRLLGCGAFAKVYHARHTASGQSVALKVISKPRVVRGGLVSNVKREIAAMRRVRHPHIVRLHEVLASRTRVYFVMELARGGELFARLARAGRLPEDSARLLFRQLLSALAFCHSRGVFHRDLKPENLLLDEAGKLKVSDFGLSAIAADQIRADGLLHTLCGTPAYVAPEILSKKGYDGAKADIWSCGVILFVLNAGYLPFNDPNLMAMYRKIYRGDYRCPKWTSLELKQLISRMLDSNPETRITVEGILRDPWFRKGLQDDELNAMMRTDEEVEYKLSKGNNCGVETEEEERDLNAFDIISFSSGFDLSGLFVSRPGRERFVSCEPAESVLERVLEVAQNEKLVVRRPKECKPGRGAAAVERPIGGLVAWVETYRLTRGLVVVEVELGGDATENGRWGGEFWREKLVPVLNRPTGGEPGSSASGSVGDRFDRIHEVDSGCKSVPEYSVEI